MKFLLALLTLLFAAAAQAQEAFPSRPMRIVVPTSPGSGSDTVARWLGEQLAAALGQSVLIENKPGANGVLAAMAVKQSPADGYTLFLGTNTHMAVNPIVVKDLPYDSVKDFKFVSGIARGMMMFVAPPNTKLKTPAELVNAAKTTAQQRSQLLAEEARGGVRAAARRGGHDDAQWAAREGLLCLCLCLRLRLRSSGKQQR